MRILVRLLLVLIVLAAIGLGVMVAGLDNTPTTHTVEKVIPNDRFR
ncbi:hypothetical protein [Rhodospirillum sp. A1_3_36]